MLFIERESQIVKVPKFPIRLQTWYYTVHTCHVENVSVLDQYSVVVQNAVKYVNQPFPGTPCYHETYHM
jgi:hypothetical protein